MSGRKEGISEGISDSQWLTAIIAKQSLACYSGEWLSGPKSGIKELFSKFKIINIQHWPCCQCSKQLNSELRKLDFGEFKTGKSGINKLWLAKYILNSHPTRNYKSFSDDIICPRRTAAPPSCSSEHIASYPRMLKVIGHRQNDIKSRYIYISFDWTDHVNIILSKS